MNLTESLLERARKWEADEGELGAIVAGEIRVVVEVMNERITALELERDELRDARAEQEGKIGELERGEFICQKCGIRKDAEGSGVSTEF